MKYVKLVGDQIRNALNQQRSFVSADELSTAIWQASNTVFGHYAGHQQLLRPGQPLAPAGYGLNDPINTALNPFRKTQQYAASPTGNQLPWAANGLIAFPIARDGNGAPTLENSFQRPLALHYPGARRVSQKNENQLAATQANSLTAATASFPIRVPMPTGLAVYPVASVVLALDYLAAPPRPAYAEQQDPDTLDMTYDDANSVDIGWQDVTAVNAIIGFGTILLGGTTKDQLAISLAAQTLQRGA